MGIGPKNRYGSCTLRNTVPNGAPPGAAKAVDLSVTTEKRGEPVLSNAAIWLR